MVAIGLLSDIHFGYTGLQDQVVLDRLEKTISKFKNESIDTVFLLGDLIHENSVEQDQNNLETVYSLFESEFDTVIAIGGNHDAGNLTADQFSSIVDNPVSTTHTVDEQTFAFIDTAFTSDVDNIGQIAPSGFDVLTSVESNPIVFSHFPITYTTGYRDNEYFREYPEGVFAINKFTLNQKRDSELIPDFTQIITGHLHTENMYRDNFGVPNSILQPFSDIRIDPPSESAVLGSVYIFDTDALDEKLVDPLQKYMVD